MLKEDAFELSSPGRELKADADDITTFPRGRGLLELTVARGLEFECRMLDLGLNVTFLTPFVDIIDGASKWQF